MLTLAGESRSGMCVGSGEGADSAKSGSFGDGGSGESDDSGVALKSSCFHCCHNYYKNLLEDTAILHCVYYRYTISYLCITDPSLHLAICLLWCNW